MLQLWPFPPYLFFYLSVCLSHAVVGVERLSWPLSLPRSLSLSPSASQPSTLSLLPLSKSFNCRKEKKYNAVCLKRFIMPMLQFKQQYITYTNNHALIYFKMQKHLISLPISHSLTSFSYSLPLLSWSVTPAAWFIIARHLKMHREIYIINLNRNMHMKYRNHNVELSIW